jgi:hypothetical protein
VRGHLDLVDEVLHVERDVTALDVGLHPVLVTGVGVDDVPLAGEAAQAALELLDRVDVGHDVTVFVDGGSGVGGLVAVDRSLVVGLDNGLLVVIGDVLDGLLSGLEGLFRLAGLVRRH